MHANDFIADLFVIDPEIGEFPKKLCYKKHIILSCFVDMLVSSLLIKLIEIITLEDLTMITIFHNELGRHCVNFPKGKYITFNLEHSPKTTGYRLEILDTNLVGLKQLQLSFNHLGQIFQLHEQALSFHLI